MSIDKTLTALAEAFGRMAAAQERIAESLEKATYNQSINVSVRGAEGQMDGLTRVSEGILREINKKDAERDAAMAAQSGETTAGDGAVPDPAKTTAASQEDGHVRESDKGSAETATEQAGSTGTRTSDPAPVQQETASAEEVDAAAAPAKVSVDQARAALRDFSKKEGTPAALELLTALGAKAISDLDEAGRVELLARIGGAA